MFSGQLHLIMVWDILYFFGPGTFVECGISVYIWSFHLLHGEFVDLFECLSGVFLEAQSVDVLVNVDSVFCGHYLIDGRTALLPLFFAGAIMLGPNWKVR